MPGYSHYITVPVNENGIIFDTDMNAVVAEAMDVEPFDFGDIYVYSHGWGNDAARALDEYNRFSVDFSKHIHLVGALEPEIYIDKPRDSFGLGIHWPSEITEDPNSPLNDAQLLTFYTMEHRADSVGKNAVYTMLRLMLKERENTGTAPRFHLIGHSFGCKVVLAALQDLQTDIASGTIVVASGTRFNVVLLEPATDCDNLDPGDIYGNVVKLPNLRMLITKSQKDDALVTWFHKAGALSNIVHKPLLGISELFARGGAPQALGAVGPTQPAIDAYGGNGNVAHISVDQNFTVTKLLGVKARMIVADLTPVHTWRQMNKLYAPPLCAGSHSDINFRQLYHLVSGFLFGVAQSTPIPANI